MKTNWATTYQERMGRADVTGSQKQGYQWPHEKDLCPPKNLKKKERMSKIRFL